MDGRFHESARKFQVVHRALRHFNSSLSLSLSLLLFREDRERRGSPSGCIRRRPLTSVVRTLAFHAQHLRFLLYVTRSITRARWRATHANESRLCTLIDHYPARLPTFSSRRVNARRMRKERKGGSEVKGAAYIFCSFNKSWKGWSNRLLSRPSDYSFLKERLATLGIVFYS